MRPRWPFVLFVISSCLFCNSSQPSLASRQKTDQASDRHGGALLQLTTSILSQDYCTDGDMRMLLRLRYTNIGRQPIILRKYSLEFAGYRISRNEEAAAKRHFEREGHAFLQTTDQPYPTRGITPPLERFVILESGRSYEVDASICNCALHVGSGLRKGDHVLQVEVRTWNESVALAQELSVAWREYGVLWWKGVRSMPMPFKIEKPAVTVKCS